MMQYPPIVIEHEEEGTYSFNVEQHELDSLLPVMEEMLSTLEDGRELLNPTVKMVSLANLVVSYAGALFNNIPEDENNSKESIMNSLYELLWDYCRQAGERITEQCSQTL